MEYYAHIKNDNVEIYLGSGEQICILWVQKPSIHFVAKSNNRPFNGDNTVLIYRDSSTYWVFMTKIDKHLHCGGVYILVR